MYGAITSKPSKIEFRKDFIINSQFQELEDI